MKICIKKSLRKTEMVGSIYCNSRDLTLQKIVYEILKSIDLNEITLISSDFTDFIDFKYL